MSMSGCLSMSASVTGADCQGENPDMRQHDSVSARRASIRDELSAIVREHVAHYRKRGEKTQAAWAFTARDLGITARRVKSWVYNDIWGSVPAEEAEIIRAARETLAAQRIATLRAEMALEQIKLKEIQSGCLKALQRAA